MNNDIFGKNLKIGDMLHCAKIRYGDGKLIDFDKYLILNINNDNVKSYIVIERNHKKIKNKKVTLKLHYWLNLGEGDDKHQIAYADNNTGKYILVKE